MQNIEIKRNKNKRSIESLIEESALDSSFNYEAHELRKAFNQTLQSMNAKQLQQQKENEKLKIMLRQYEQRKGKLQRKVENMQSELTEKNKLVKQLTEAFGQAKKKLQYLQYKMQTINENRYQLEAELQQKEPRQSETDQRNTIVNEVYKEMEKVVARKIECFTQDIKKMNMTRDLQDRIQTFLEQLIYLNPHSEYKVLQQIKKGKKENLYGKIIKDRHQRSQKDEQWKIFEKSLQKLKQLNQQHKMSNNKKTTVEDPKQKSVSRDKRRRLFNN